LLPEVPGVDTILLFYRAVEAIFNVLDNNLIDFLVLSSEEEAADMFMLEALDANFDFECLD